MAETWGGRRKPKLVCILTQPRAVRLMALAALLTESELPPLALLAVSPCGNEQTEGACGVQSQRARTSPDYCCTQIGGRLKKLHR